MSGAFGPFETALALAAFAGAAMPLGALLALLVPLRRVPFHDDLLLGIVAFGGGALLSAVALVLVPEGADLLPPLLAVCLFMAGGVVFYLIDKMLERRGGGGAQMLAMLLDFLPEAMALGAMLTAEAGTALLLAAMMALQNLPEGFSAFRDIRAGGQLSGPRIVLLFAALALLGPVCAGIGLGFLSQMPGLLGGIMLFSAGGILYLVFQDVAPDAHSDGKWNPALGAVTGFALGLAGHVFIG